VRDVRLVGKETRILSCSLTGRLKLWSLETGELVRDIDAGQTEHATCLDTVERDGEALAAVSGVVGGVKVVELQGGQCLVEVGPACCPVRVVRFSADGRLVVTGHDTGTVQYLSSLHETPTSSGDHLSILQIWDCLTGAPLSSPLFLHSSWVTDLAISSDCSTLLTAGDRLVWWSLPPAPSPTPPSSAVPVRRKLSLPLPRARRSSGSNKRDSLHLGDEDLADSRLTSRGSSGYGSPVGSVESPARESQAGHLHKRLLASLPPPTSPVGKRKVTKKQGAEGKKELLQTFDVKGSLVSKVWVNPDFTQFVTVDDAGICYILDEYIPAGNFLR